jgi:hypothetical protein
MVSSPEFNLVVAAKADYFRFTTNAGEIIVGLHFVGARGEVRPA